MQFILLYLQNEIKQLQKELSKTKSNIFSIASNVAESVSTGIDGAMKSLDKELDQNHHVINENIDVTTRKPTRGTQHSLFRHKKEPHEPVQLLSFRRNSLSWWQSTFLSRIKCSVILIYLFYYLQVNQNQSRISITDVKRLLWFISVENSHISFGETVFRDYKFKHKCAYLSSHNYAVNQY